MSFINNNRFVLYDNCYKLYKMLGESCFMLEIKEFRQIKEFKCYETKIEESEKAGRHRELIEPRTHLA